MVRLQALKYRDRSYLKYGTRRLLPGDTFEASDSHARLLTRMKKAVAAPDEAPVVPRAAPTEPCAPKDKSEVEVLRSEAIALGLTIDARWGARRLRTAIANTKVKMI